MAVIITLVLQKLYHTTTEELGKNSYWVTWGCTVKAVAILNKEVIHPR